MYCRQLNHSGDWNFGSDQSFESKFLDKDKVEEKNSSAAAAAAEENILKTQKQLHLIPRKNCVIPKFSDYMFSRLSKQMKNSFSDCLVKLFNLIILKFHSPASSHVINSNFYFFWPFLPTKNNE